ncbi:probable glycosyltransferase At5g25310 [Musa acuminata AAA Group]|uniref:probable glycosyltransferase At5g25310 n=1 Tax=Musa acuminata AAA Group TaxID=214697 RepID=UPI0031E13292
MEEARNLHIPASKESATSESSSPKALLILRPPLLHSSQNPFRVLSGTLSRGMECRGHGYWSHALLVTLVSSAVILLLFAFNHCSSPISIPAPSASAATVELLRLADSMLLSPPATPIARSSQNLASNASLLDEHTVHSEGTHRQKQKNEKKKKSDGDDGAVEQELAMARAAIRRAASRRANASSVPAHGEDVPLLSTIYRNPTAFFRSYTEMERRFRVYVYEEGEPPLVHEGPCKNIYTTEGRFIEEMEITRPDSGGRRRLRTWDPARAHAFFLPFSVTNMVHFIHRPSPYDHTTFKRFVADYVDVIASKHPFWNRSAGADHFMLSCHDWGPHASRSNPNLYENSIRALCNANTSEGFDPRKDVSIPEINLYTGHVPRQLLSPRLPGLASRPYLAFFAGGLHGPIRHLLLRHWKGRDAGLPVHEYLPHGLDYYSFMLRSRFCLCPSGYEVASPRVVEAIYAECVPVIISKSYVLPFSDVLRWESFSVSVAVEDIPRLKQVLEGVSMAELSRLRDGVKAVKRHFVLNQPAKRFDVFHMILHSVWLRRLNIKLV